MAVEMVNADGPLVVPLRIETMDGKSAYQFVVSQLEQPNIPYGAMEKLIPSRMMLYGEDGWAIAVTPTLLFSESEGGIYLHLLKTPVNLRDRNWQGKGCDFDLSYQGGEIPGDQIVPAVSFVKNLAERARKLRSS